MQVIASRLDSFNGVWAHGLSAEVGIVVLVKEPIVTPLPLVGLAAVYSSRSIWKVSCAPRICAVKRSFPWLNQVARATIYIN